MKRLVSGCCAMAVMIWMLCFPGSQRPVAERDDLPAEKASVSGVQSDTDRLEARVRSWAESVRGLSSAEQALLAHEFLTANCTYDDTAPDRHNAAGALLNGRAVCDGYASGYLCCMTACGIPCRMISGEANGVPHAWNLIQLGSEWYHVDCTWDDREESDPQFRCFLCDDETMRQTHQWDSTRYPAALGHAYSYSVLIQLLRERCTADFPDL